MHHIIFSTAPVNISKTLHAVTQVSVRVNCVYYKNKQLYTGTGSLKGLCVPRYSKSPGSAHHTEPCACHTGEAISDYIT